MNRLSDSASLYLRQHADNPVAWHPWDDTALEAARESGRPILLSIGYSACHWCHVMAHESFEDPATAGLMNDLFVNVKVDREERPDLDRIYQLAHQLLTGRGGGWPLTVFLDPHSLTPFFAGTYFPPTPRHGMPAFRDVLQRVRAWHDANPEEVAGLERSVADAIAAIQRPGGQGPDGKAVLRSAANQALQRADRVNGGFGGAPKFPQAPLLAALPALARAADEPELLEFQATSLEKMSRGGLRDHLDGGLFRYTVDGDWTIPHFEKMLYDNALLLPLYAEAGARRQDAWLAEVASGIADWLTGTMRQTNGGFSSSTDADAAGREGGFHVWDPQEFSACLDAGEYAVASTAFGLDRPPNFEGRYWHLTRRVAVRDEQTLARAVRKLRAYRDKRPPPATDGKQLAAWNALAVDGFARAGQALGRMDWLEVAESCLGFIRTALWREGALYAVHAEGAAHHRAYLDDHAFLLQAVLSLLRARWQAGLLPFAVELADTMLARFEDPAHGGFYFTATGAEAPVHRLRVTQDDATPSGNGVAARALLALGHLQAEPRYLDAADRLLAGTGQEMAKYPLGHASLLLALDESLHPPTQVLITGEDPDERTAWKSVADRFDRVNCYALPQGADTWPAVLAERASGGETLAYLCQGLRCLPPVRSVTELEQQLTAAD